VNSVVQTIATLFAAIGGLAGLVAFLTVRVQKRKIAAEGDKTQADAAKVISDTALILVKPLEEKLRNANSEAKDLENQLKRANARANGLEARAAEFEEQLAAANGEVRELRTEVAVMTKEILELREENQTLRQENDNLRGQR
jgi:chromosome segregation ATPase